MSTFHLVGMRSLRLTAMRIALIGAVTQIAAGVVVMLHQPGTISADFGTNEAALVMIGTVVNPAQESQSDGWDTVHHLISSSFARRSQLFF